MIYSSPRSAPEVGGAADVRDGELHGAAAVLAGPERALHVAVGDGHLCGDVHHGHADAVRGRLEKIHRGSVYGLRIEMKACQRPMKSLG